MKAKYRFRHANNALVVFASLVLVLVLVLVLLIDTCRHVLENAISPILASLRGAKEMAYGGVLSTT